MKYNRNKKKLYRIYKIECNINLETNEIMNEYIPIYIGCTCQSLKLRFLNHNHHKSRIYPYIKKYGKEHFRIIEITTIISNEFNAHKLEEKISKEYKEKYQLLNDKFGDKATEKLKNNLSIRYSKKKIQINDKIYESVRLAAKALNVSRVSLYYLLIGKTKKCKEYELDFIKDNIYTLKKVEKYIPKKVLYRKKYKFNLIEEQLTFFSIKDLADYLKVSRFAIQMFVKNKRHTCKNKKIIKIIQHDYYNEYFLKDSEIYIFNMNTKDVSISVKEALKLLNLTMKSNHIRECCLDINRSIKGNHFRYLTDEEIKLYKEDKNNRFKFDCTLLYKYLQKSFVMNIEKGIIYETPIKAIHSVRPTAVSGQYIINCCKGKSESVYGYHWRYLTIEEIKTIMDKKIKRA